MAPVQAMNPRRVRDQELCERLQSFDTELSWRGDVWITRNWLWVSIAIDALTGIGLVWVWKVEAEPWWREIWFLFVAGTILQSIYRALRRLQNRD